MGEREQLEGVITAAYPAARRFALMLCRDPAEADDLTQDAVLRIIRRPPDPLTEDVVRAWLRTAITRLFLSARRRLAREARSVARAVAREPAPDAMVEPPDDAVVRALQDLSPKQRACIVLRYLEDLSEHDVARILAIRHGTVKAHLAVGRERLRVALADRVDDPVT